MMTQELASPMLPQMLLLLCCHPLIIGHSLRCSCQLPASTFAAPDIGWVLHCCPLPAFIVIPCCLIADALVASCCHRQSLAAVLRWQVVSSPAIVHLCRSSCWLVVALSFAACFCHRPPSSNCQCPYCCAALRCSPCQPLPIFAITIDGWLVPHCLPPAFVFCTLVLLLHAAVHH